MERATFSNRNYFLSQNVTTRQQSQFGSKIKFRVCSAVLHSRRLMERARGVRQAYRSTYFVRIAVGAVSIRPKSSRKFAQRQLRTPYVLSVLCDIYRNSAADTVDVGGPHLSDADGVENRRDSRWETVSCFLSQAYRVSLAASRPMMGIGDAFPPYNQVFSKMAKTFSQRLHRFTAIDSKIFARKYGTSLGNTCLALLPFRQIFNRQQ